MKETLRLSPVEMSESVMQNLEDRGLIIRLFPDRHKLEVGKGEARGESIYESDVCYGAHKLITVTVNRFTFDAFGSHPDNEEFLFIGNPNTKPMYLIIALHRKDAFNQKIAAHELTSDDFICLQVTYNDPYVSFFTMLADVPHGEAVADKEGDIPSFYVTEPCNLGIEFTDFGPYCLEVTD